MKSPIVIYICSAGHSGSTLLDLLLGSHSGIFSLGEISHLPKNIALNTQCACGEPVKQCSFWESIANDIEQCTGTDIMSNPYDFYLGYFNARVVVDRDSHTRLNRFIARIRQGIIYADLKLSLGAGPRVFPSEGKATENNFLLYETVTQNSNCDLVVDSSKSYIKAVNLYRKNPDAVRIILLTRDGRGVMQSNTKRGYDRNKAVRSWKNYYQRAIPLLDKHVSNGHLLQVKYEDLATKPAMELEKVCHFLQQRYESEMLDFAAGIHHVTNGNDMRFGKSSEIRFDSTWQKTLSKEDADFFEITAGKLNRELGYQ